MSNSVDPDKTARYEPSHLDLRYLQKPITFAFGFEKDNVNWNAACEKVPLDHNEIAIP